MPRSGAVHIIVSGQIGRQVTIIVSNTGIAAALAAKLASKTIPTVFVIGADPAKFGPTRPIPPVASREEPDTDDQGPKCQSVPLVSASRKR